MPSSLIVGLRTEQNRFKTFDAWPPIYERASHIIHSPILCKSYDSIGYRIKIVTNSERSKEPPSFALPDRSLKHRQDMPTPLKFPKIPPRSAVNAPWTVWAKGARPETQGAALCFFPLPPLLRLGHDGTGRTCWNSRYIGLVFIWSTYIISRTYFKSSNLGMKSGWRMQKKMQKKNFSAAWLLVLSTPALSRRTYVSRGMNACRSWFWCGF